MAGSVIITSYWFAITESPRIMPRFILSILDPGAYVKIPGSTDAEQHLKLEFHDVADEGVANSDRRIPPNDGHVRRIIDFAKGWDQEGDVLIHCVAGVSRSPAAGLIILAALNPGREAQIARTMRQRAPWITPNARMVRIADEVLGLKGRLKSAVGTVSEATGAPSMVPLKLPARF